MKFVSLDYEIVLYMCSESIKIGIVVISKLLCLKFLSMKNYLMKCNVEQLSIFNLRKRYKLRINFIVLYCTAL